MSLATLCQESFSHATRQKGRDYFQSHLVDIVEDNGAYCNAVVSNPQGDAYGVRLMFDEVDQQPILRADCACQHFEEGHLCKHLWATLLSLDKRGNHILSGSVRKVDVIHDPDFDVDDEGEDEDYLDGDDDFDDEDESFFDDDEPDEPMVRGPYRQSTYGDLFSRLAQLLPPGVAKQFPTAPQREPSKPQWQNQLKLVQEGLLESVDKHRVRPGSWNRKFREAWYAICIEESLANGRLTIALRQREKLKSGGFGKLKDLRVGESDIEQFHLPTDRNLLDLLLGDAAAADDADDYYNSYSYSYHQRRYGIKQGTCVVAPIMYEQIVPRLCATGRCGWLARATSDGQEISPLEWDNGPAWKLELKIHDTDDSALWVIEGALRRGEESVSLNLPKLLLTDGLVIFPNHIARLDAGDHFAWISPLRKTGPIKVPKKHSDKLLTQLWSLPTLPEISWPAELQLEQVRVEPKLQVSFSPAKGRDEGKRLAAQVSMDYNGRTVGVQDQVAGLVDLKERRVMLRDTQKEQAFLQALRPLGFSPDDYSPDPSKLQLPQKQFPRAAAELIRSGYHVEAQGIVIRRPGTYKMNVVSGVDWFELEGEFDFDGVKAGLPELLAALRRGEQFVTLGDGTQGMLPEEWLNRYGALADMATVEGDKLRFKPSQAMLLDALLASQPNVEVDAQFELVRQKLHTFAGVQASQPPETFTGTLRDYQTQGLGWLHFLRDFHFGGCLADDMGLGKTVQVLAMLEARRTRTLAKAEQRAPCLAVVPRSLVYNWIEEAKRFTPNLRVLDYTGLVRREFFERLDQYDLVITTYGTLRRDIVQLKDVRFDYAILDESQAIKNATSQSAKACRLIQADHRLAMTGTPIENHLGELWSLFEFLNPGMLGRSSALKLLASGNTEDGSRQVLAHALRPFMLRRTKEQVLKELPEKTEQTLYCELDKKQRKLYDELRDHFRAQLTQSIAKLGINKSKIHVLEALLRLRQAACHPGLIDKKKVKEPSAKLETLLEQLDEVLSEGHKVLVFSQFTSLLDIVRNALTERKITFEYLDGQTRDRQARVENFQQNPQCPVFLISLKAGGQGLNLTAADYVFILDPWWNPAAEAQAVDRAHRIGQTRRVFAYRLIARNTVEEKILELQRSKRQLADAILSEDNSLISDLTADDLQMLLS